jgi:hypothetical protein
MKWKIIIEKMIANKTATKEAIINIKTSPQTIVNCMKFYGWDVTYLVPITEMEIDKDNIMIETRRI